MSETPLKSKKPGRYHFSVALPGGRRLRAAIVPMAPPPPTVEVPDTEPDAGAFTNLRWVHPNKRFSFAHGDEVRLEVTAREMDGKKVRFVVEQQKNGKWELYRALEGEVKGGKAQVTLQLNHPVLPARAPTPAEVKNAKEAKLRFHLVPA